MNWSPRLLRHAIYLAVTLSLVVTSSNVSAINYTEAVIQDNPIGYWKFDDGAEGPADGQTAINFAGGLDGTYVGGNRVEAEGLQIADGRIADIGPGNLALAMGFEGTDGYMSVPESLLSGQSEFTMTGWVNAAERGGNRIGLFGQNDVIEFGFINPNTIQLWTPVGQTVNYAVNPDLIQDNTWFHVGLVGTGTNTQLFINGDRVSGAPGPDGYGKSNDTFNIGGGGIFDATGNQFTGFIDEVAIYNKALTDDQVLIQASATEAYSEVVLSTAEGNVLPIGYWGFEEDGPIAENRGTSGETLDGEYINIGTDTGGPDGAFPVDNRFIEVDASAEKYVAVSSSPLSGLSEFTISGWIAPGDQLGATRIGLFGQNDAIEFGLIDPTTLQIWTPGGGALDVSTEGTILPDEWNHIAAVGTGEEIRFFINGELVANGGSPINTGGVESYGESGDPFNVGGGGVFDASGNQFTGVMDEVALWDTALSEAQILAQFNSAFGDVVEPVAGDADADGKVDAADLNVVGVNWQMNVVGGPADGDFNNDGIVNAADLNVLGGNWQFGVGAAAQNAAVPEPAGHTLMLSVLVLLTIVRRRRAA